MDLLPSVRSLLYCACAGLLAAITLSWGCRPSLETSPQAVSWPVLVRDPAEDGVRCYAPDGALIGKIHLPEGCANLCFGGVKKDRLFMCASTSVYALYINGRGAMIP